MLLLTAKSEVDDKVKGLDSGANDYLTKPFDARELLARIRAMTRQQGPSAEPILCFGNITLNRATLEISSLEGSFFLTNKEYQVLELLMSNPRHLIPTERVFQKGNRMSGCRRSFLLNQDILQLPLKKRM